MKRHCFALSLMLFFSCNALSASEPIYVYDDAYVSFGGGLFYHSFSGDDALREETGMADSDDSITSMMGFAFNAELLMNKTFSLEIPFGLAAGYRFQYMDGGYAYSGALLGSFERKVAVKNHILCFSAAYPLDAENYYLLGVSAGAGLSVYAFSLKWSEQPDWTTFSDSAESAHGLIVPVGFFLDWGADGIGARLGCEYILSKYEKLDGDQPRGNGYQIYLNLRYAI
ncbi:MAG: hypothetical protein ACRCUT_00580 [Spirochaetota bacterium]